MAAPVKILAFGDSLTAGYGLPEGDGFVPQLQQALQKMGREVTVINGGVSGDTTAGGLSRLDWMLADKPDAVILELGANDMLRGLSPDEARANLDADHQTHQGIGGQNAAGRHAGVAQPGRRLSGAVRRHLSRPRQGA